MLPCPKRRSPWSILPLSSFEDYALFPPILLVLVPSTLVFLPGKACVARKRTVHRDLLKMVLVVVLLFVSFGPAEAHYFVENGGIDDRSTHGSGV